jgi:hypothetical protein
VAMRWRMTTITSTSSFPNPFQRKRKCPGESKTKRAWGRHTHTHWKPGLFTFINGSISFQLCRLLFPRRCHLRDSELKQNEHMIAIISLWWTFFETAKIFKITLSKTQR